MYVLIAGVVFTFILYTMAISPTIDLVVENSSLEQQIANNQHIEEHIEVKKQKLQKIEQLVGNPNYKKEEDIHQTLLGLVTNYAQKNALMLKDFPKPYIATDKGYITHTVTATLEGDFIQLLKLVYDLEKNFQAGKVIAVDFKAKEELRTRTRKLNAIIYLQNVKAENHEKNS